MGTNYTVDSSGNLTCNNTSGTNSGDITLSAVGSSPNANGASLSSQILNLQPADSSNPGVLTTGAQTIAGIKTFSSAPNLSSLTASQVLQTDGSSNITTGQVTNSQLANMNANTFKGNNTGSSTAPSDLTVSQAQTLIGITTGSYTPTIGDGTNNFTTTSSAGTYSKIGNTVLVSIFLLWSSKGSASSGSDVVISLPFNPGVGLQGTGIISDNNGITFSSGNNLSAYLSSNNIKFLQSAPGGTTSNISVAGCATSGILSVGAFYRTA